MTRAAALLGLLTTAALAEPRHLPPGLNAVRILDGEARLVIDGRPDDAPTLLPEGVYFTASGYEAVERATLKLQDDLEALRGTAATPCPPNAPTWGWSTHAVVMALLAGVLVGAGGALVLTR